MPSRFLVFLFIWLQYLRIMRCEPEEPWIFNCCSSPFSECEPSTNISVSIKHDTQHLSGVYQIKNCGDALGVYAKKTSYYDSGWLMMYANGQTDMWYISDYYQDLDSPKATCDLPGGPYNGVTNCDWTPTNIDYPAASNTDDYMLYLVILIILFLIIVIIVLVIIIKRASIANSSEPNTVDGEEGTHSTQGNGEKMHLNEEGKVNEGMQGSNTELV
eukprot:67071_1